MRKGRIDKSEKSENNLTKGIKIVDLHKEKLKKEREERQKMLSDEKTENNYTRFRKAILCLIISIIIVIVISVIIEVVILFIVIVSFIIVLIVPVIIVF